MEAVHEDIEFYDCSEFYDASQGDIGSWDAALSQMEADVHRPLPISTVLSEPRDEEERCDLTPSDPQSQAQVTVLETPVLRQQGFEPRSRGFTEAGAALEAAVKQRRNAMHLRYNGFYPDVLPWKPPVPTIEEAARAARSVRLMTSHPGGFGDLAPKAPDNPKPSSLRLGSSFRARRASTPISEITQSEPQVSSQPDHEPNMEQHREVLARVADTLTTLGSIQTDRGSRHSLDDTVVTLGCSPPSKPSSGRRNSVDSGLAKSASPRKLTVRRYRNPSGTITSTSRPATVRAGSDRMC